MFVGGWGRHGCLWLGVDVFVGWSGVVYGCGMGGVVCGCSIRGVVCGCGMGGVFVGESMYIHVRAYVIMCRCSII